MSSSNLARLEKEDPEDQVRRGDPQKRLGYHPGNAKKGNRLKGLERTRNPKMKRWVPKEWKPVYEEIVQLDAMGVDQEEIADRYNFTKIHISNICSTPHAKIIRASMTKSLVKRGMEAPQSRLTRIADKAMDRIDSIITDDDLFHNNPLPVADRSFKFLKELGILGRSDDVQRPGVVVNQQINNNGTTVVTDKMVTVFNDGMDKLKEINAIHGAINLLPTGEIEDVVSPAPPVGYDED